MTATKPTFPIRKSFLCDETLAHSVEEAYGFSDVRCQLITASMRDVYLVTSRDKRYVLYIYRCGHRIPAEILAEWKFVEFLYAKGIPVAPAVPNKNGEWLMAFEAPEGMRHGVLAPFVNGKHLRQRPNVAAVRTYGRIVAQIHAFADMMTFDLARPTNDWETLIDQSIAAFASVVTVNNDETVLSLRSGLAPSTSSGHTVGVGAIFRQSPGFEAGSVKAAISYSAHHRVI